MARTHRAITAITHVTACAALIIGTAGCTDSNADPRPLNETTPSAAGEASSAVPPESTSPEDIAIEESEDVVLEFYRVFNKTLQDPSNADLNEYEQVAINSGLHSLSNMRTRFISNEWTMVGGNSVEVVSIGEFDLTNKPEADPPVVPGGELMVCVDASEADIVNKDGESVVGPDAPVRRLVRIGVANYEYPDGPWLVAFAEFQEGKPC